MKPNIIKPDDIKKYKVHDDVSIKKVLRKIDKNKQGVAFVVDDNDALLGTITDGDVRRYILKGGDLDVDCAIVMNKSYASVESFNNDEIIHLMAEHGIKHVPLLTGKKKLEKIFKAEEINDSNVVAVIMAGGEGKRLKEVTGDTPKPLTKIKEKTMIEENLANLKEYNIDQVYLTLNYRAEDFKNRFKDGSDFGIDLKYIVEDKKLGTAGALSLLPKDLHADTILVMNADVLTSTNFNSLINYYNEHHLLMCIAAKEYTLDVPFGIFEVNNGYLTGIKEKPTQKFLCNAGIYVLNKEVLKYIPKGKYFDMTDLIKTLVSKSLPIGAFPLIEYWIDIGNINDFNTAKKEYDTVFKRKNYE